MRPDHRPSRRQWRHTSGRCAAAGCDGDIVADSAAAAAAAVRGGWQPFVAAAADVEAAVVVVVGVVGVVGVVAAVVGVDGRARVEFEWRSACRTARRPGSSSGSLLASWPQWRPRCPTTKRRLSTAAAAAVGSF